MRRRALALVAVAAVVPAVVVSGGDDARADRELRDRTRRASQVFVGRVTGREERCIPASDEPLAGAIDS